nr:hypothetical protein [Streptomyces liangshanensis]
MARHKVLTVIGGVFAFVVVVGIAAGGSDGGKPSDTAAVAPEKKADAPAKDAKDADAAPAAKEKPAAPAEERSAADRFKAFVTKNGLDTEKSAVEHVTKVQGADEQNDILDSVDIYTDYSGGFMSENASQAKLIASAFADWKDSENGLVTVYGKDGDLITNGNF